MNIKGDLNLLEIYKELIMRNLFVIVIVAFIMMEIPSAISFAGIGGQDDPVVTKRYVDDLNAYRAVEVSEGSIILGGSGSELILRSGRAYVYSETKDGLVNATTGHELYNGDEVLLNNMLIVSRDDNRGLMMSEDSWILVRGSFKII